MLFRPWTLRSISIILLLAVSGLDLPAASLGWAPTTTSTRISTTTSAATARTTRRSMTSTNNDNDETPVKVLGVCGGIGSGKSTACKLLVESCHCLAHIDADKVAHSVYAPGSQAVQDVVAEFGTEILVRADENSDNEEYKTPLEIDRKKLGAIVFAERPAMAKLEVIVWPHVKDRLIEKIQELKDFYQKNSDTESNTLPVVILEAAILLDAGWDDLLDGVWAVTVPPEHARKRLVETRGLTEAEAQKRIDAQESRRGIGSLEEELQAGNVHCVISNDKSLEELQSTLSKSLQDPTCWRP